MAAYAPDRTKWRTGIHTHLPVGVDAKAGLGGITASLSLETCTLGHRRLFLQVWYS